MTGFQVVGGAKSPAASSWKPSAGAGQETITAALVRRTERRGGALVQRYSLAPLRGRRQRVPAGTGATSDAVPPVHWTLAGGANRDALSSSVKLRDLGHVLSSQTLPVRRSQTLPSVCASPKSTTLFEVFRCWPYQAAGSTTGELVSAVNVTCAPAFARPCLFQFQCCRAICRVDVVGRHRVTRRRQDRIRRRQDEDNQQCGRQQVPQANFSQGLGFGLTWPSLSRRLLRRPPVQVLLSMGICGNLTSFRSPFLNAQDDLLKPMGPSRYPRGRIAPLVAIPGIIRMWTPPAFFLFVSIRNLRPGFRWFDGRGSRLARAHWATTRAERAKTEQGPVHLLGPPATQYARATQGYGLNARFHSSPQ